MPPFQGGERNDQRSHLRKNITNEIPFKFEAETPNIAEQCIAFKVSPRLHYGLVEKVDKSLMKLYLLAYATKKSRIKGFIPVGLRQGKSEVLSF